MQAARAGSRCGPSAPRRRSGAAASRRRARRRAGSSAGRARRSRSAASPWRAGFGHIRTGLTSYDLAVRLDRAVRGPGGAEQVDRLVGRLAARVERVAEPERVELLAHPAGADPEDGAPAATAASSVAHCLAISRGGRCGSTITEVPSSTRFVMPATNDRTANASQKFWVCSGVNEPGRAVRIAATRSRSGSRCGRRPRPSRSQAPRRAPRASRSSLPWPRRRYSPGGCRSSQRALLASSPGDGRNRVVDRTG